MVQFHICLAYQTCHEPALTTYFKFDIVGRKLSSVFLPNNYAASAGEDNLPTCFQHSCSCPQFNKIQITLLAMT